MTKRYTCDAVVGCATRDYDEMFWNHMDPFQNGMYDPLDSRAGERASDASASIIPQFGNPLFTNFAKPINDSGDGDSFINSCRARTCITLDPDVVGWVIGKRGVHIKKMKQITGCVMWLNQSDLTLHIMGKDTVQEEMAASLVKNFIQTAPVRGVNMGQGMMREFTTKMIHCPARLTGLLIGRNGISIKRIKQQFMVSIIINQIMGKAIICGSEEDTEKAVSAIENIFICNGFKKDEAGLFTPCDDMISPITPISVSDHFIKKNSFFSLLSNSTYNTAKPARLVAPSDSFDKPIGNFSVFGNSSNNISVQNGKVNCDSTILGGCSTPISISDQSSVSSTLSSASKELGKSLQRTPTPVYNDFVLPSDCCTTTQVDFASVGELLESINLRHYLSIFTANEMDMDALRLSCKEDFRALGLSMGASIKLAAAVNLS